MGSLIIVLFLIITGQVRVCDWLLINLDPRLRHSRTSLAGLSNGYLSPPTGKGASPGRFVFAPPQSGRGKLLVPKGQAPKGQAPKGQANIGVL